MMPLWFWVGSAAAMGFGFGYGVRGLVAQLRGETFRDVDRAALAKARGAQS